jgi:hypothetical protein
MVMKVITPRFWIVTVAIVTAVVFVFLALFLATPGAGAGSGAAKPESGSPPAQSALAPQSYEGMITDTHCGAKHSAAVGMTAADCTRACIHSGEQFSLVDGEKVYNLKGNEPALKGVAGQRVKIGGTLDGNTISVSSVAAAGS